MKARPAVFLDRDGTVCREVDYLSSPEELELLPGAAEAIRDLNQAGYLVVIVTNQSGVARGRLTEETLGDIHVELVEQLAEAGAFLDGIEYCPHHPQVGEPPYRVECDCRKPLPGMLERAAATLGADLSRSWIIGDAERDLLAGAALDVPGWLVLTGKGTAERAAMQAAGRPPERFARDLREAVTAILAGEHASR